MPFLIDYTVHQQINLSTFFISEFCANLRITFAVILHWHTLFLPSNYKFVFPLQKAIILHEIISPNWHILQHSNFVYGKLALDLQAVCETFCCNKEKLVSEQD